MAKISVTADQLVERKGGWTTYLNAKGNVCKARNTEIEVTDGNESARSPAPTGDKPLKVGKATHRPQKPRITAAGKVTEAREDLDEDEEDDSIKLRRIGNTKHDCSHYERTTSAGGNKTLDSGDELATELRGFTLDEVYAKAAKVLGESRASLEQRYSKLNPGMQRMNLGNRMRAALKKKQAA